MSFEDNPADDRYQLDQCIAEIKSLQSTIAAQAEAIRLLREAAEEAHKFIDAIMSFYGTGLEVANWHMNGDLQSWDTFFDDNSTGDELTKLSAALAATEPKEPSDAE